MSRKRNHFTFIALIILLLSFASMAQAAPPLQEDTQADTSLGDSFNLDDDGNVIEEDDDDSGVKQNLGTIMSGRNDGTDDDDGADEGCDDDDTDSDDCAEDDDDTGDDEDGDDCANDDGDASDASADADSDDCADDDDDGDTGDDDDSDGCADDGGDASADADSDDCVEDDDDDWEHPVAAAIADYFGVEYEEVMGYHQDDHYGFGVITKAYFFAEEFDLEVSDLLDGETRGWGNILKEQGMHPGTVHGNRPEHAGPPDAETEADAVDKTGKPDKGADVSEFAGPGGGKGNGQNKGIDANAGDNGGHGRGNGNGHGNGGGNGKGKGKGKGKNK
jgi:hypothetical protein